MARMHSRKKGLSGSTRPQRRTQPSWVRYKAKELEMLIVKIAKEGHSASEIGLILRDSYGVPDVKKITDKNVSAVLRDHDLSSKIPEDLAALLKKVALLKKHIEENRKDMPAKRGIQLTESKIKRLVKYYKKTKKIPMDWKYDPKRVSHFIE
ncbi:30S ribosomal protein S15 [Candidatus Woesearchaeota archaeon]|nr:30S ribosomal protein S15 [Candidatus Woesearchaeota archaeon]